MQRSGAIHSERELPIAHETWAPELQRDPRWSLAQRVVAGSHFVRSPLLSKFLLFIVAEAIQGHDGEITEHQIGVQVFDRPPGYRTIEDNIVRNYARQLRKRLAEHFAGEGGDEPVRIDVPVGGYVPVFVSVADGANADSRSLPLPNAHDAQQVTEAASVSETTSAGGWNWRRWVIGTSLLLA